MNSNMYHSQGNTVWSFLLAVIVMTLVFALGLNVNDALTASSQNYRAIVETDIESQKAAYDLRLYGEKTQIEIEEMRRQAEAAALKQAQDIEFRGKMLNAVVLGAQALFIGFAAAIAAYGISNGFRRAAPAPASQPATPRSLPAQSRTRLCGPKSLAGRLARKEELRQRLEEIRQKETAEEKRLQELFGSGPAIWKAQ